MASNSGDWSALHIQQAVIGGEVEPIHYCSHERHPGILGRHFGGHSVDEQDPESEFAETEQVVEKEPGVPTAMGLLRKRTSEDDCPTTHGDSEVVERATTLLLGDPSVMGLAARPPRRERWRRQIRAPQRAGASHRPQLRALFRRYPRRVPQASRQLVRSRGKA